MAEYIDRERLLRRFNLDDMMNVNGTLVSLNDARNIISGFPAADVAPVVRCKDCKFYQNHALRDIVFDKDACHWNPDEQPDPDDFCSCGERRG